ncbi:hypothetical protein BKG80_23475 [Mycobacteroides chelonae]|uniref:DUF4185 domain-containing protein n=1 Tax=Mycobacteroides chelonae TaxID=1774 RepID=UPI0008A82CD6|nr:DUF4185 domain-containing protein [Mycobacteroides chelonae]OHU35715.1 hypothetical protein BKG80_23475 [Mycobacteroides chelonae]
MAMNLKELRELPPEVADLAKATRAMATNHTNSADFYRALANGSSWQGQGGDAARAGMFKTALGHEESAETLNKAATHMDAVQQESEKVLAAINNLHREAEVNDPRAVEIDEVSNQVVAPSNEFMDKQTAAQLTAKVTRLQGEVAGVLAQGEVVDADLARAIGTATGVQVETPTTGSLPWLLGEMNGTGPLKPGQVRNLGPIAGTEAASAIPGIGAADLGEVVELPDGRKVAVFGDSFSGNKMGEGDHYRSVAVPVEFDAQGRPHFGAPLTAPMGKGTELFPMPPEAVKAGATDMLPAGSVKMNGETYMMVTGTKGNLEKTGSWLVKVTNDPAQGWQPVEGSWRSADPVLPDGKPNSAYSPVSQFSGYQGSDGKAYIAADAFDRSQGTTMYQVDPAHGGNIADRSTWQPWTGNEWGTPTQQAIPLTSGNYGELSFREIDGKPVLSGFNGATGATEVRVGSGLPTDIFKPGVPTTVVAPGGDWANPVPGQYPQNYGGYIMPGSTLDNMNIWVSQWNTGVDANGVPFGAPYTVEQFQVNANR